MKLDLAPRQAALPWGGMRARPSAPAARATSPRVRSSIPSAEPVDRSRSASGHMLRDYQAEAAEWLRSRSHALLADEIGLGKTATWLRALRRRDRAIVVCPAYLRNVWRDELPEWRPDLRAVVVDELVAPAPGEVCVMSFEALPPPPKNVFRSLAPHLDLRDVALGVDEAHYAKNPRAARTRRVTLLARQCGRVWPLTGTPLLNTPPDLRGVLAAFGLFAEAYGDAKTFDRVFGAYRKKVKRDRRDPLTGAWVEGLTITEYGRALPEAGEMLRRVMLRRLRRDFLELPPIIEREIRVDAPEDLRGLLDQTLKAWESWGDPDELPPFELFSSALAALARSRIPAATEHVRQALAEGPIVVFSAYRDPVLALAHLPRTAVVTGDVPASRRKELADQFQAGRLDCLAGTIDAMGMGLTLTRAARVLLIDEDHTPAMNEQAVGRLLRHGQTQSVLVERMRSDHPLDVSRGKILARKIALNADVVGS